MQFVCQVCIFIDIVQLCLAVNKFLIKAIAMSSLIIRISNVADGNRLGTMLATNPVGIRQIDTNSRRRIKVSCKNSRSNHFSRHTFHFLFLKLLINRRVVFKPLRIGTDNLCTMSCLQIFKVDQRLPAGFHTQWITITFCKSIHKIDP